MAKDATRLSRRKLLRRGLMLGAVGAVASFGYTWLIEPFWWRAVHHDMPVANLPADLAGRTLVQISDLHIGPRVSEDYITKAVRAIGAFNPDIVVITGDVVQFSTPADVAQASRVLKALPHGRLATIAILGNHDYGAGWQDRQAADRVVRCMTAHGIRVLRNELVDVAGLQIVGLDDLWAGAFHPEKVLPAVDRTKATIALTHNPDTVDKPGWGNWQGWILAGHTHGGQCKPPFLPPPLLPVENKRYTRGAFDVGGGRTLYVNAGLGYLRQVRFNVRPEITVCRMRSV